MLFGSTSSPHRGSGRCTDAPATQSGRGGVVVACSTPVAAHPLRGHHRARWTARHPESDLLVRRRAAVRAVIRSSFLLEVDVHVPLSAHFMPRPREGPTACSVSTGRPRRRSVCGSETGAPTSQQSRRTHRAAFDAHTLGASFLMRLRLRELVVRPSAHVCPDVDRRLRGPVIVEPQLKSKTCEGHQTFRMTSGAASIAKSRTWHGGRFGSSTITVRPHAIEISAGKDEPSRSSSPLSARGGRPSAEMRELRSSHSIQAPGTPAGYDERWTPCISVELSP